MTDDTLAKRARFERVAEIFARVRRAVPAEREAYLEVECGDDAELQAEVRALLASHVETPAAPIALVPGVPGFRIVRRIGVGGMGTVYEAEQEHPRRRVALKVLRLDALSEESLARFENEARALARLQHPGIARIFEAGRFEGPAGDMPYLVMELVDGPSITDYASSLSREARIELLIAVCEAVEHAHQRGILHRDLKPANILVPDDERPRVLDFGVAREIEEPSPHTRTGHLLGTLAYMSPEQARGEFEDLDTRCDIYALGVIGYELMAGRLPHAVQKMPLLEAARVVAEAPHKSLGKDDLAVVLDKALAKDRDRRYPSASAFADDLRRVLNQEPVRARRPSRLYHVVRFAQRNRAIVATIAVAVVGLLFALLQAVGAAHFARKQESVAARARYAAQIQAATSHLDMNDIEAAQSLLRESHEAQRGWMWGHLAATTDADVEAWTFDEPVEFMRGFDPARPRFWSGGAAFERHARLPHGSVRNGHVPIDTPGGVVVTGAPDGRVRLLQDDAPARDVFGLRGRVVEISFDRGRALVVSALGGGKGRMALYDTSTRRPFWVRDTTELSLARFADDGRSIVATTVWDGGLRLIDPADGAVRRRWTGHTNHLGLLAVAPKTGLFATFAMDWNIRIWDRDGALVAAIEDPGQWVHALAFSPDGRVLASGHPRGTVRFWDATTGELAWAAGGTTSEAIHDLAWDGDRIYCRAGRGVFVRRAVPTLAREVVAHHATAADGNRYPYVYDVAFSRDGELVASIGWDGTARVCDARTGALLRTLKLSAYPERCAFGRDGLFYAVCGGKGAVEAWDAATGRRLARRPLHSMAISVHPAGDSVAILADGKLLRLDPETLAAARPGVDLDGGTACAYSPDGSRVACGNSKGVVSIVEGDAVVAQWTAHDAWILSIDWAPDGSKVVVGTREGHVSIFDATSGERVDGFVIPEARIFTLAHSGDGRLLFVGSDEHAIRVWDTVGGNGLARLRGHRGYVKGLAFSPDGAILASASGDNTVRLWHRRRLRERR